METLRKLECIYAALRLDDVRYRNHAIVNYDWVKYMECLQLLPDIGIRAYGK